MNKAILFVILIVTLLVGVGTITIYSFQNYTYSLEIKDEISTSDIYIGTTNRHHWNGNYTIINESLVQIGSISMLLGKMKFETDGVFSQFVEIPKLVACVDLNNTDKNLQIEVYGEGYYSNPAFLWPVYTIFENILENKEDFWATVKGYDYVSENGNGPKIVPEINPYEYTAYSQKIEVESGKELVYYIYLRDASFTLLSYPSGARSWYWGRSSTVFRNGKIRVYEIPITAPKEFNPISVGLTYDSFVANPTCDTLAREFDPVKIINII